MSQTHNICETEGGNSWDQRLSELDMLEESLGHPNKAEIRKQQLPNRQHECEDEKIA